MTTWSDDHRPVRRIVANEYAPVGSDEWPASIPAVGQILRDGLDLPAGVTLLVASQGVRLYRVVPGAGPVPC